MPHDNDRDNRHPGPGPVPDRVIEKLQSDVASLMKTKQNKITAAGNSIILARGVVDGEFTDLYRKDVINGFKPDVLNIPSEIAVVGFVDDRLQRTMHKVKVLIQQDNEKVRKYINDEQARAIAAEADLKALIAVINIDDVKNRIDEVAKRAAQATSELEGKLTVEVNRSTQEDDQLRASIEKEISRASDVEGKLHHDIHDEVRRATAAEKAISDRQQQFDNKIMSVANEVLTEKTRAESAEKALDAKFSAHVENLQSNTSQIRNDLQTEVTRAIGAEGTMATKLAEEINRAKSEEKRIEDRFAGIDGGFNDQIDDLKRFIREQDEAERNRAMIQEGLLAGKITDEIARSTNVDDQLRSTLTNEITRSTDEDTKVKAALQAEVSRATLEERSLKNDLQAEVSRSTSRDEFLDGKITSETTRAVQVEDQLYHDIDAEKDRAKDAEKDLDDKIKALTTTVATEVDRSTKADDKLTIDLAVETTRAKDAENRISSDLAAEVSRARTTEDLITDNLQAEITRSSGADQVLTEKITNEVSRATNAEKQLNDEIVHERTRAISEEEKIRKELAAVADSKVDKNVAGVGEKIVKNVRFSMEPSPTGDANAKQLNFHKTLLSLADGSTETSERAFDLAVLSGAHDVGIGLAAEVTRAIDAERVLRNQIDNAITTLRGELVHRDFFKSNGYRVLSSIDIQTTADAYGSQFWTRAITKNVSDGEEIKNENHYRSDDINFGLTALDQNDNLFDIKVNQATAEDINDILVGIFG